MAGVFFPLLLKFGGLEAGAGPALLQALPNLFQTFVNVELGL